MSDEVKMMEEIRAFFGLTIYNVQLFEQQLVSMIFAAKLDEAPVMQGQDLTQLFGQCFNHTIETLFGELQTIYQLDSHVMHQVNHALGLRLTFSYRYFSKRNHELFTEKGRLSMLKELEKASLQFTQANNLLKSAFNRYLKTKRIFKIHIDQMVARAFKQALNSDSHDLS